MKTNSVGKGTFQITFANAIQYFVMGLFYIVVTKTNALTPTDLGVLSVLSFISSTLLLSTLALPTALTKFVSEHLGRNELQKAASVQQTVTRTVSMLSLGGLIVATILSSSLSQYFWGTAERFQLIILISISALFMNLILVYKSRLQALRLFGKMAFVTITFILSSRIIAVVLALQDFGVSGVILGYIIGSFIGLIVAITFTRGKFPNPDNKTPIKPLLQFSLPLFLGSLALLVLSQADIVILASVTADYALVGIYSIAVRSLSALSVIWHPIMVTMFPIVSARFGLQDQKGVGNVVKMMSRYLSYTIIPSCIVLSVVAPTALNVFYGPDYVSGATVLSILAISVIVSALFTLVTTTLTAIGKTKHVLQINLVSATSVVVLLLSLVPLLGIIGAAITRLVVQVISLILAAYMLKRYVSVQLDREALWKSTLASAITIPFLFVLESRIFKGFPAVPVLAVEILVAGFIYVGSLYVLKALNDQDFDLIRQSFPKSFSKTIDTLQSVMSRK